MTDNLAWSQLKKIDVEKEKMVKKKGKYSYISWAMAWSKLCDIYPDATFEKHCNEQGFPYFKDENGWCFTKVTVIVNGKSITEMLPVLNNYNKPIENPDSSDVNTSLQRCLAKAVALHGLGVHVYSGEDIAEIPDNLGEEEKDDAKEKDTKANTIKTEELKEKDPEKDEKVEQEEVNATLDVFLKIINEAKNFKDMDNALGNSTNKPTLENLKLNDNDTWQKIMRATFEKKSNMLINTLNDKTKSWATISESMHTPQMEGFLDDLKQNANDLFEKVHDASETRANKEEKNG